MWPYWIMFLIPALASFSETPKRQSAAQEVGKQRFGAAWISAFLASWILIGYRDRVGGDWNNYLFNFNDFDYKTLGDVLGAEDPAYHLLEWISLQLGGDIFVVNLMGGLLFAIGLVSFCRSLPRPWLALAVSVPYLVIVVTMGYSRQGIAIGLGMLGLTALKNHRFVQYMVWTFLAAAFHKTAVILIPIAALAATRRRLWTAVWVSISTLVAYVLLLQDSAQQLYSNYIEAGYQSQGAFIRLAMNAVPATILLAWRKRFVPHLPMIQLWTWMSLISLVIFGLLLVAPSSTSLDRIALYLLPLQLVVFSTLPDAFGSKSDRRTWILLVLAYYLFVELVWLNFAANSRYWIPYRLHIFAN